MIRPLNDRVVIRQVEALSVSSGGLFIPEQAKEKPMEGEVIAISDNTKLKVGEKVLFGRYSGVTVNLNGEELLLMREDEVYAVVE